mgnify:CR=1 FL=1
MVKMITKMTTNMVNKNNTRCRQVKDSYVVFVHYVGGHVGDYLDHHSKHLHSVHGTSHICFSIFVLVQRRGNCFLYLHIK